MLNIYFGIKHRLTCKEGIEGMVLFGLNWHTLLSVCNAHVHISMCTHTCFNLYMYTRMFEGSGGKRFGIQALDRQKFITIQLCHVGQGSTYPTAVFSCVTGDVEAYVF